MPVIYYGAALPVGESASPPPPTPEPFVFCAARLAERKGLDILVMAFAALDPSLHLVLCGEDHSAGGLQRFIAGLGLQDRVHWLGQLPHDQVQALMRRCLFFVLPSRRESLGGAIIEAMQAGKAVVATRVGGVPELVQDGVEGLLVEAKDVSGLAAAMKRLYEDGELRQRLAAAALRASERFSWQRAIDDYLKIHDGHPARLRAPASATAFVMWELGGDQTALALAGDIARGFKTRGRKLITCFLRSADEPFAARREGAVEYRLGLAPASRWRVLHHALVALQLSWIALKEGVGVWHFFSIRDLPLTGFLWFMRIDRIRPVVTLA